MFDIMTIFVGYNSAYQFWDKGSPEQRDLHLAKRKNLPKTPYSDIEVQDALQALALDSPLDILVPTQALRHVSQHACVHLAKQYAQKGDYYLYRPDIFIASPELCYLQLARGLKIPQAAALAMEMCGSYSTKILSERSIHRQPLTSIENLRAYASTKFSAKSSSQRLRALTWVSNNSLSPMESALYLALCLPPRLGGFNIPFPQLNAHIELTDHLAQMAHKRYLMGDLVWKKERLIVEYNSDQEHTGGLRISEDARRINALKYAGYNVIVITKRQLQDSYDIRSAAEQIAKALGRRLIPRNNKHDRLRQKLYADIFPWWTYIGL